MTPAEQMMNSIHWEPVEVEQEGDDNLPHVTHIGYLGIGDHLLKCYQLSDGNRVIDAEDINKFFAA